MKVTLDEYIEISKYYSGPGSSVFINGVLDKLVAALTEEENQKRAGPHLAMRRLRSAFGAGCAAVGVALVLLLRLRLAAGIGHFRAPLSQFRPNRCIRTCRIPCVSDVSHSGETARLGSGFLQSGGEPLVVVRSESSCGCTSLEYDAQPIMPGDTLRAVRFDTSGQRAGSSRYCASISPAATVRCGSTSRPTCSDVGKSEIIVIFAVVNRIVAGKRSRTVCGWRRLPGRSGRTKAEGRRFR